jgi:hypothetical protein
MAIKTMTMTTTEQCNNCSFLHYTPKECEGPLVYNRNCQQLRKKFGIT